MRRRSKLPPVFASRAEAFIIFMLALISLLGLIVVANPLTHSSASPEKWRLTIFSQPPQTSEIAMPAEKHLLVTGKLGPAEIEWDDRGNVRIASSTCPCRTCVNMGWSGEAAVICVPNGIMVEPQKSGAPAVDAVTR
ncbi:MAG TPA: NusG domain II-containing protein [Candidatus Rifleibacterium sp.]|nr:NusG domain II-containing protein [Candidatus Rifleibacterium sp.]